MAEPRRPGVLETLLALTSTLAMAWVMMPPQERMWIRLSLQARLHRLTVRAARRAGYLGMGDELGGRDLGRYQFAYCWSLCRDWLERQIQEQRA